MAFSDLALLSGNSNRTLLESHRNLHITEEAFARVAELLQENLEDAGVIPADVQTIMGIVASAKSDIVG